MSDVLFNVDSTSHKITKSLNYFLKLRKNLSKIGVCDNIKQKARKKLKEDVAAKNYLIWSLTWSLPTTDFSECATDLTSCQSIDISDTITNIKKDYKKLLLKSFKGSNSQLLIKSEDKHKKRLNKKIKKVIKQLGDYPDPILICGS